MAGLDALLKDDSSRNLRSLLKVIILVTIAGAAVASRLFSVIRQLPIPAPPGTAMVRVKLIESM